METRVFGKTGIKMPLLGMGVMRPPMLEDKKSIDEAQAIEMFDLLYAAGVRYYDTAYVYMDGRSEELIKKALVGRYPRESFYIADKLPIWCAKSAEDCEKIFETSLERLGTSYIDFYLLHALDYEEWRKCVDFGADKLQRRLKAEGRVHCIGFSFHGPAADLEKILAEQGDWDFVQLQMNYYDWYSSDAEQLYELLEQRGIPCVVMEPVRGGSLHELGDDVREILQKAAPDYSNVGMAMRWVGSLPNVRVVLSGVSSLEQARENSALFSPLKKLSFEEEEAIVRAVGIMKERETVPCTGCGYCGECPQGVDIKRIFNTANETKRLMNDKSGKWRYSSIVKEGHGAEKCVECGLCAQHCPQGIDIPAELRRCAEMLSFDEQ